MYPTREQMWNCYCQVKAYLPNGVANFLEGKVKLESIWKQAKELAIISCQVVATKPLIWYHVNLFCVGAVVGWLKCEAMIKEIGKIKKIWTHHRGYIPAIAIVGVLGAPFSWDVVAFLGGGYWGSRIRRLVEANR